MGVAMLHPAIRFAPRTHRVAPTFGRAPRRPARSGRRLTPGRRSLLAVLAIAVSSAGLPPACSAAGAQRPNVLVLLADDLGFSDLGCYGGEIATPHLDALAANGLRYAQFYNTARCWPTRAALLTGFYAQQIRRDALPDGRGGSLGERPGWAVLLPQLLRPLGYRSYHAGKWHVDGTVLGGGFDRSYSLQDHNRFFAPQEQTLDDQPLPPTPPGTPFYATTAIADRAIEFLAEHRARHAEQPFFAYVAFTSPHFPLHAPAADVARYQGRYEAGWDALRRARWQRLRTALSLPGVLAPLETAIGPPSEFPDALKALGPGEVRRELPWDRLPAVQQAFQASKMEVHAAMVDRMDQEIGRILAQLRRMDAWDDTLVVFLSDNGASAEILVRGDGHDPTAPAGSAATFLCLGPGWSRAANAPFRRHKSWVHEGGIATPLIVHWPQGIAARGEIRRAVGHVIDLAPTIVQVAGGSWPPRGDRLAPPPPGRSLAATWEADRPVDRPYLWWLHEGNRALRRGDWKLVAARDEPWELYDLSQDRSETRNLAAEFPDLVEELESTWLAETAAQAAASRDAD